MHVSVLLLQLTKVQLILMVEPRQPFNSPEAATSKFSTEPLSGFPELSRCKLSTSGKAK